MNILVIQNRMGIGDMVIFLPFIEAISKKYNSPITLLIKESTKAKEYTKNLNFLKNIIYLKRDNKDDEHSGGSEYPDYISFRFKEAQKTIYGRKFVLGK